MADQSVGIDTLTRGIENLNTLDIQIGGDDQATWEAPSGEQGISFNHAVRKLFENGGLPAKPFPTLAKMNTDGASLADGTLAQVYNETANNGLYLKTNNAWVKSAYDPLTQAKTDATNKAEAAKNQAISESNTYSDNRLSEIADIDVASTYSHVFVDDSSKILASIDNTGKFDLDLTDAAKERLGVLADNGDTDYAFLFLDAENKVLGGWDKNGNNMTDNGHIETANSFAPAPLTHLKDNVQISDFSRVIEKLNVNTIAKGRLTDPDIVLNGNGYTHPKLVYVPESWNGYKYWMAVTPTFGITPKDAYENPHVFCSNDMLTWIEPTGAPLDLPDPSTSTGFWSDTHLVIDDDGWMYCFYRGSYFYGHESSFIVAKKTRDGLNWSERMIVYDPAVGGVNNGILSPAIYKNGTKWQCVDILLNIEGGFDFETSYGRGIFRRSSNDIMGDYGTYTLDHLVNITNRPWGGDRAPWHIDAIKVGNLYLILLAVGRAVDSYANELYLAWSSDGWNYTAFDKLNTLYDNCYRSSISLREVIGNKIHLDVIVARTTGTNGGNLDLFNLTLEAV